MSDRRYEVYEVCPHEGLFVDGATGRLDGMKPHPLGVPTGYNKGGGRTYEAWCPGAIRLSSIPDALVEEAAKAFYEAVDPYLDANRGDFVKMPLLSREQTTAYLVDRGVRAALSVLFPGEEEE